MGKTLLENNTPSVTRSFKKFTLIDGMIPRQDISRWGEKLLIEAVPHKIEKERDKYMARKIIR